MDAALYLKFSQDGRIFSVLNGIHLIDGDRVRLVRGAVDADDEESEVGLRERVVHRGGLEAERFGEAGVHADLKHF